MCTTLESSIESFMKSEAERRGCMFMKFVSPGNTGVPDRILLHPRLKRATFVELKAPGEKPRNGQKAMHRKLSEHGADVFTVDTREAVLELFRELKLSVREDCCKETRRCLGKARIQTGGK